MVWPRAVLAGVALIILGGMPQNIVLAQSAEVYRAMKTPVVALPSKSCRQLWYIEHRLLAAGRICPSSERAERAFRSAKSCISSDERVLPGKARDYLGKIRQVRRDKACGAGAF